MSNYYLKFFIIGLLTFGTMCFANPKSNPSRPVFMVLPAASKNDSSPLDVVKNNPFAKAAMEGLNEYLTEKGYEVKSLEGSEDLANLIQIQSDISYDDEDMSYIASLAMGADIYIKFSGAVKNRMVTIELSAYEASTARLLGSKTGMVENHTGNKNHLRYLVHSAAKKALPALEKNILAYWEKDSDKGVQYKVLIRIGDRFSREEIEDIQDQGIEALRKKFQFIKINGMTDKTIDLTLYADEKYYSDAFQVYSTIRRTLSPYFQTKKNNITNKLIIFEAL